jgi:taurine-pyruvate aminotransferase
VADCFANNAVVIGASNRSIPSLNNTLLFSPALIAKKSDIDEIVSAVDGALTRVANA